MQIENAPLLNVQNAYIIKESAVSDKISQASMENDYPSSVIDAGPAAVFEKGGMTNGMTGSIEVSHTTPMGSAGMLYAAGIMPTALENDIPAVQEDSADNMTGINKGMNINDITKLIADEAGKTEGAKWSAVINPSDIRDGSVISINGVKFEFDTDNSIHSDSDTIKVDISTAGALEQGDYASDVATAFVTAVNDNAEKVAQAVYGEESLPSTLTLENLCSWRQDQDNGSSEWKLQLEQATDWMQAGNTFAVETGTFVGETFVGAIQQDTGSTQFNINNLTDDAAVNITIGDTTHQFNIQTVTEPPESENIISSDGKTIQLYKPEDISASTSDLKTSLETALTAALKEAANGDLYTVAASVDENGIANLTITPTDNTNTEQPILAFQQEGVPAIKNKTIEVAGEVKPAYLEYEVDMSKLQSGDYFRFRDMCFIFTDSDTSDLNVPLGDEVNPVYININQGTTPQKATDAFVSTFETYFAPSKSGSAPSRGGTVSSNIQYPTRSPLKRYSSDKFQISFELLADNKFKIKITAVGQNLLEQITLGDDEGWGRSKDSTGEDDTTGTDTTTESSESENTETQDVTNDSEPDSAALSQPETETTPPTAQNGSSEQSEVVETEVASDNSTEETEADTAAADEDEMEATGQTNKEEEQEEESGAAQEPQNSED